MLTSSLPALSQTAERGASGGARDQLWLGALQVRRVWLVFREQLQKAFVLLRAGRAGRLVRICDERLKVTNPAHLIREDFDPEHRQANREHDDGMTGFMQRKLMPATTAM
jgi:hypothetical protein